MNKMPKERYVWEDKIWGDNEVEWTQIYRLFNFKLGEHLSHLTRC